MFSVPCFVLMMWMWGQIGDEANDDACMPLIR